MFACVCCSLLVKHGVFGILYPHIDANLHGYWDSTVKMLDIVVDQEYYYADYPFQMQAVSPADLVRKEVDFELDLDTFYYREETQRNKLRNRLDIHPDI